MEIEITDESMKLHGSDLIIATATRRADCRWQVGNRPMLLTRNQAITALVLAERFVAGCGDIDPFVTGWRQELACD
jgi:hypothetical protein